MALGTCTQPAGLTPASQRTRSEAGSSCVRDMKRSALRASMSPKSGKAPPRVKLASIRPRCTGRLGILGVQLENPRRVALQRARRGNGERSVDDGLGRGRAVHCVRAEHRESKPQAAPNLGSPQQAQAIEGSRSVGGPPDLARRAGTCATSAA
eukprot:scaffold11019_cov75-Phaeocystis_antarctica.AAC.6